VPLLAWLPEAGREERSFRTSNDRIVLQDTCVAITCGGRCGWGYGMDLLDRLLGHDQWATGLLLELSHDLTDAQLDQPFDVGHRMLRATFEHMIFNVEIWTGLMAGQPVDAQRDERSLSALIDRYERSDAAFVTLARLVRDEERLDG
jgi:hypothetical protein